MPRARAWPVSEVELNRDAYWPGQTVALALRRNFVADARSSAGATARTV